jgi:MFS family permease
MGTYRTLLKIKPFRALWFGTLMVRLGVQFGILALTWLVLDTTGSPEKIGIVLALYAAGDMAASPLVGIALDRWPRKLLLNADNIAQTVIFASLAVLFIVHHLPFAVLLVLVIGAGALSPLSYLGRMIILPNVVNTEQWERANTAMQLNMNLVALLGPALGGVLVAIVGVGATLAITALCYAIYFCTLAIIPAVCYSSPEHTMTQPSFRRDLVQGWKFLGQTPVLLTLVVVTLMFSLTYGPLEPALPVLIRQVFHQGAETLGVLWSSFAAGAVLGTLVWGRLRPQWPLRAVVSGIIVLWGLFSSAIGFTSHVWVAAVFLALGGLAYAPYTILFSLWRQKLVPDTVRGKVFGTINGITGIGLPLGQALGGLLVGVIGPGRTVELGGAACVVLGVIVYSLRNVWKDPPPSLQNSGNQVEG